MKLRYAKHYMSNMTCYVPEYDIGKGWIRWTKDSFSKNVSVMVTNNFNGFFTTSDHELYFVNEVFCNAWLGACKIIYKDKEIVDFEHLN